MNHFWRFARLMLEHRGTLIAAVMFAFIAAGGLGVGIVSAGPILRIILKDDQTLLQQAEEFNASEPMVSIPTWVIERLPEDRLTGVAIVLGGIAILTVFGAAASFLHAWLAGIVSTRTAARVRLDAFRAAVHLPMRTVITRGPAEFVARIVRDTIELQNGFLTLTSRSVAQVTKGIAAFIAAIIIDWRLTLVAIIVAPVMAVLLRKLGKRIQRGTRSTLEAQEDLLRVASESIQGLRSVKAATAERVVIGRFRAHNVDAIRGELRVRLTRAIATPLIELLAIFVLCGLALFAAREILDGSLSFERFFLAIAALGVAGASFKPLTAMINDIQAAGAPAERLASIVDEPAEDARRGQVRLPRHRKEIRFESVSVRYPGQAIDAISEISLTIPHGETVAFVGANGCGKTTLVSLLPRLIDPNAGRVLIDGVDLDAIDLRAWRQQVGVVTQETVIFRGTVAENIAFGVHEATREQIEGAARRAHAEAFIRALPNGFETEIAELGASLSGGQRQRLAIARAILRDPSVLILDEATSQIDPESERDINAAINDFRGGRTILMVAHRPSTMRAADRIVVMDAGTIVDSGTHDELIDRCDLYRRIAGAGSVADQAVRRSL